jgi:hypothetical protein
MGSTPDFSLRSVLFILDLLVVIFVVFFVFDLLFSMLPVSLDSSFLIATLVFYCVYITVYPVSLFSHLIVYYHNQYSTSLNRSLTSLLKIYTK